MSLYYETIRVPDIPPTEWTVRHILEERARTHADKVFLDVPAANLTYTYAQTADLSFRIATGLLDRGHIPGDRLVIMMSNCAQHILAWLGSAAAGLVEVPINTAYHGAFLEHQVRTVAPTGIVTSPEFVDRFIDIREACDPSIRFYISGYDAENTSSAIARLTQLGFRAEAFCDLEAAETRDTLPELRAHSLAAVFFTSGTTGPSKGVMMSGVQMFFFACEGMSVVRLTDSDTYMSVGPLFHGNAQILAAYPSLIAGARFVLRERFSASSWIQWIRESGATVTNLIGVMTDFIWKQPRQADESLNSLRCISAVPTPTSLVNDWVDRFGPVDFVENFGMTEISLPILTPYGVARPPGAAGLLVKDWFDVQLVNPETDEQVAVGEVGELGRETKVAVDHL